MSDRRRVIIGGAACVAGLGAGHVLRPVRAEAASRRRKASKAAVHYQDKPKGIAACSLCSQFVKPDKCKIVVGKIAPDGWCDRFEQVD
jgi:hypothetical protein